MNIDLAETFWQKMDEVMQRPAKQVGDTKRVSRW
jgi:hypothetical protein